MFGAVTLFRSAALLTVATVAIALAACGESTVQPDTLEAGVTTILETNIDVDSVSCPDDVSQDEGTDFECDVSAEGDEFPVGGTITGTDGDDVLFELNTVDGTEVPKA